MYERVLCFRLVFSQIERRASSLAPRPRVDKITVTLTD